MGKYMDRSRRIRAAGYQLQDTGYRIEDPGEKLFPAEQFGLGQLFPYTVTTLPRVTSFDGEARYVICRASCPGLGQSS